ncbi:hypothetical protein [Prosthecochloris sp. CIB 2401]|uniref:hypothetical protein n=1 Tax=Prosthecochloris sp. CIB 2401 TaxID=1868325 RepID=UPI00080AA236|nr:hypothetical protein [Prosthecochloris sp. CIB 2401]ANT64512.1 Tetratricopeptide repeat protein [Prosthecochloris sp. CIB 2401]
MNTDPHHLFAEVSLDIARGAYHAGVQKLGHATEGYAESYTYHVLLGKALKGVGRYREAREAFMTCCRLAPQNEVARQELLDVHFLMLDEPADRLASELEQLSIALQGFTAPVAPETSDPTPVAEQRQPFSDEESIPIPTESLAALFAAQGAVKKAIRVYTELIGINPAHAASYKQRIKDLLDKL